MAVSQHVLTSEESRHAAAVLILALGLLDLVIGLTANHGLVPHYFRQDHQLDFSERLAVDAILLCVPVAFFLLRQRCKYVHLLLVVHAIAYALLVAEVVLQASEARAHISRDGRPTHEMSPMFHHDVRANQSFTTQLSPMDGDWGPVENRINALGIRGPELAPKAVTERRVLLLGDSFIEADEITFDKTVGQQLQSIIGSEAVRVIQHGVFSWSPLLELNWLAKRGLALKPDVVVLFLCINDFHDATIGWSDAAYARQANFDVGGLPRRFNVGPSETLRKPWNDLALVSRGRSAIRFIRDGRQEPLAPALLSRLLTLPAADIDAELDLAVPRALPTRQLLMDYIRLARPAASWTTRTKDTVGSSLKYVALMDEILRSQSARLVITLVPFGWNVSLADNRVGRRQYLLSDVVLPMGGIEETVKSFCLSSDIPYVDLHAELVAHEKLYGETLYLSVDGHWNPRGHRVVAEALHRQLLQLPALSSLH